MAFPRRLSAMVSMVALVCASAGAVNGLAQARLKHAAAKTLRLPAGARSLETGKRPPFLRSLLTSPWGGRVIASSPHPEELVS
jgi:hypothetical protein